MSYSLLAGGVYETLLFNNGGDELQPMLARSYEWQDETTLVFELQEGVKFHNGNDFTSEDVLFTIERLDNYPN